MLFSKVGGQESTALDGLHVLLNQGAKCSHILYRPFLSPLPVATVCTIDDESFYFLFCAFKKDFPALRTFYGNMFILQTMLLFRFGHFI